MLPLAAWRLNPQDESAKCLYAAVAPRLEVPQSQQSQLINHRNGKENAEIFLTWEDSFTSI